MADANRVSTAGVYAVVTGTPRVSTAGVYIVHGPNERRLSTAGVYVVTPEVVLPPPPVVSAKPTLKGTPASTLILWTGSAYSHPASKAHKATEIDLNGTVVLLGPVTEYLEEDLAPGATYGNRRIRYQDEDDNWSAWSNPASVTLPALASLPKPTLSVITPIGATFYNLYSSDPNAVIVGIQWQAKLAADTWDTLFFDTGTLPAGADNPNWWRFYWAEDTEPLTAYLNRVRHLNAAGVWSPWSNELLVTTVEFDPPPQTNLYPMLSGYHIRERYYGITWGKNVTIPAKTSNDTAGYAELRLYRGSVDPVEELVTCSGNYKLISRFPGTSYLHRETVGWGSNWAAVDYGLGAYTILMRWVSTINPCSPSWTGVFMPARFFVHPPLLAPRINSPAGNEVLTGSEVTVNLGLLTGAPYDAVLDLEYSSDGVVWTPVATGVAAGEVSSERLSVPLDSDWVEWITSSGNMNGIGFRIGNSHIPWNISGLAPGVYQLRTRMRSNATADNPDDKLWLYGYSQPAASRWRYGVPLYVHMQDEITSADTSTLDDWEEGGVLHAKDWSANPLRSKLDMTVPYYHAQLSGRHWQGYTPIGQPRDIEISTLMQFRAWNSMGNYWNFNAKREGGVGSNLAGSNDTVWDGSYNGGSGQDTASQVGLTAITATLGSNGGGTVIPEESTLHNARPGVWRSNLIYGRERAQLFIGWQREGSNFPSKHYVNIPGHAYVHDWVPEGISARDPWYQVRMRTETLKIYENGNRDYKVMVQAAGPDLEPVGPNDWQFVKTIIDAPLPCGLSGCVAWMGSAINPDTQVLFRSPRFIPLAYGECEQPPAWEPPPPPPPPPPTVRTSGPPGLLYLGTAEEDGVGFGWSHWSLPNGRVLSIDSVNLPGRGPVLAVTVGREDGVSVEYFSLTAPTKKRNLPASGLYVGDGADSIAWSRWDFGGARIVSADATNIPGLGPVLVLVVDRPDGLCLEYLPIAAATDDTS
jgi:hypothetical protein